MLCIRLLGGFSVERNTQPIVLSSRKTAALLAVLAARPGAVHRRERIAALLWSRSAEPQARGSLRQALAQLRRDLGDSGAAVIVAQSEGIRLDPAGVEVDVAALEAALAEGTPESLTAAAALYAGDFLDGFALNEEPFMEWQRAEAFRLRETTLRGLGRLLARHVESGDVEAAAELGERLLALEPAAEDVHQALIRLHLARGALGSAMRQYERCRDTLAAELGVKPAAETEALRRQIVTRPVLHGPAEPAGPPTVAVLPFLNLSADPTQGYFALGFAEDIIRELSRFRSLRVISRQSSFALAEAQLPPPEIGARLGARYLLSGSLRRSATAVRVGTELVEAATGHQLWAHSYNLPIEEMFELQDEIARNVVGALSARIDEELLQHARRKPLESLAAYDCWLRGLECLRRLTREGVTEARALFARALDADPHFARAFSGLSLTYFNDWGCHAWGHWEEDERKAFEYASQAVALDETDHVTHVILGRILLYRRDFERAERHFERAGRLNPNDAETLAQLSLAYGYLGRPEQGIAAARTAMRLNPFHNDGYFIYAAMAHFVARDLDEGVRLGLKAPGLVADIRAFVASAYAHMNRMEAARQQLDGFLYRFQRRITFGTPPAPDEPARWLVRVNPFKRPADTAYLLEGLARAGLPIPADSMS